jgi:hypothetical protein
MRGITHDIHQRTVAVEAPGAMLHGDLALPDQPHGVIRLRMAAAAAGSVRGIAQSPST